MNGDAPLRVSGAQLALQTRLDHRGGLVSSPASLFPPRETFAALGGREAVARLVDGLYDRFEKDPVLRPAFSRDLSSERERVKRFFEAWLGGSPSYFGEAWSPGLHGRHGGITISRGMAGRWVKHFLDSLAQVSTDPSVVGAIKPLVARLAMGLVNRSDEPAPGERLRCSATNADPQFLRFIQRDDAAGIATSAAAQPRLMQQQGARLLLIAAIRGKPHAVEALLQQGVDVNTPAMLPGGEAAIQNLPVLHITPLCAALAKNRVDVVNLLVEHGAQYDIFTAAFVGDLAAIRALLDAAPGLTNAHDPASDVASITPLTHAVDAGQFDAAKLLFERGANVGDNGVRLVRAAANAANEALVELLLEHGASAAGIGPGNWVLFPSIADSLIARGADVNHEPGKWIGLCCTGNSGHKENAALANALVQRGADVAAIYKGRTALHCAAKAGFINIVTALIEHGANVNALNSFQETPLDDLNNAGRSIDSTAMRRLLTRHGARRSGAQA